MAVMEGLSWGPSRGSTGRRIFHYFVIASRYESEKVWPRPSCGVYVAVMLVRVPHQTR